MSAIKGHLDPLVKNSVGFILERPILAEYLSEIMNDIFHKLLNGIVQKGRSHPIGNLHRVLPTHGFLS